MQYDTRAKAGMAGIGLTILTPYISRLIHGVEWALQYIPAHFMAIAFFMGFAAIPGVVLWVLTMVGPKKWELPYLITLLCMCLALATLHHDVDLAADA
ncbi:MAG: hypothetical protein ACR2QW_08980, partial [bacterium]